MELLHEVWVVGHRGCAWRCLEVPTCGANRFGPWRPGNACRTVTPGRQPGPCPCSRQGTGPPRSAVPFALYRQSERACRETLPSSARRGFVMSGQR